tara:strand:- start:438 stop:878 length:441 start_codon:yes stop_codon:yes gene_type:complete
MISAKVPSPKKLLSMAADITKTREAQLRIPPPQMMKLKMFLEERDILAMTPEAFSSFMRAMQHGVNRAVASSQEVKTPLKWGLQAGAQDLKRLYTDRFLESGGDVALKALSRAWATRKRRRGLDPRIGYATGALARAIAQSTIVVR